MKPKISTPQMAIRPKFHFYKMVIFDRDTTEMLVTFVELGLIVKL